MEALLIPLAKGFFGLMGISSFLFFSVKQDIQIEIQAAEAEMRELQPQLELKIVPEKKPKPEPKQVPQKK